MSENKWLRRTAAVLAAAMMLVPCSGCTENSGSEDAGKNDVSESNQINTSSVKLPKRTGKLTDEQKELAANNGISEDRYCADNTDIVNATNELLSMYCDGMIEEDFDKCYKAFPSFYRKAAEDENEKLGITNEKCMELIKDSLTEEFGDDMYMFASADSNRVIQISDDAINDFQSDISDIFDEEIKLDDMYNIFINYTYRGSKSKDSYDLEMQVLVIDGYVYLYDDYYEIYAESSDKTPADAVAAEQAAAKENEEKADAKKAEDSAS